MAGDFQQAPGNFQRAPRDFQRAMPCLQWVCPLIKPMNFKHFSAVPVVPEAPERLVHDLKQQKGLPKPAFFNHNSSSTVHRSAVGNTMKIEHYEQARRSKDIQTVAFLRHQIQIQERPCTSPCRVSIINLKTRTPTLRRNKKTIISGAFLRLDNHLPEKMPIATIRAGIFCFL
jgi:hypothetical protein